ncbi:MAG TPA: methyltransferase, partial [Chitinophagaceae bacterium]|nr:methyltransferase [Chitinophagaceae bacterium]
RNPMYVGVTMILIGEAIFFQSVNLWIYLIFVFIAFNIFILLHEEPRLRKDFGEEYRQYCQKVRRWV